MASRHLFDGGSPRSTCQGLTRVSSTAWPSPFPPRQRDREISPLGIWVCLPASVCVCLSDHPSFRRDILIHHRVREVKPLRCVLCSSRNEYAYLKVVRKSLVFTRPRRTFNVVSWKEHPGLWKEAHLVSDHLSYVIY